MPVAGSRECVEQRLCVFEIGRVEAFGEPAVKGREQVTRFDASPLFAPQPCSSGSQPQFEKPGTFAAGHVQASRNGVFKGFPGRGLGAKKHQLDPVQFWRQPHLPISLEMRERGVELRLCALEFGKLETPLGMSITKPSSCGIPHPPKNFRSSRAPSICPAVSTNTPAATFAKSS